MFCEKIMNQKGGMRHSIVMMKPQFFPNLKSGLFLLTDSLSFHHLQILFLIHCPATKRIHNQLWSHNKKTQSASLPHCTELAMFFQVWVMFLRPTVKIGLLFRHHSHDPKFHHLL